MDNVRTYSHPDITPGAKLRRIQQNMTRLRNSTLFTPTRRSLVFGQPPTAAAAAAAEEDERSTEDSSTVKTATQIRWQALVALVAILCLNIYWNSGNAWWSAAIGPTLSSDE